MAKTATRPQQHAGPIVDDAPFHDWGSHTMAELTAEPYTTCSANLKALEDFIVPRYGLSRLGCHGVRPVRGGTRPSTHTPGAATDLRYMPATPDLALREICVNQLIPLLIDNHEVLGVQAIHDYYGCRIWRAGRGWKTQQPDAYGMGQKWAGWLHIETHPNQWANPAPIEARLGLAGDHPLPPFNPSRAEFGLYPKQKTKPKLRRGSRGDIVRYAQAIVGAISDGAFGPQTDMLVKVWQQAHDLDADGIIGPNTWKAIDKAALELVAKNAGR